MKDEIFLDSKESSLQLPKDFYTYKRGYQHHRQSRLPVSRSFDMLYISIEKSRAVFNWTQIYIYRSVLAAVWDQLCSAFNLHAWLFSCMLCCFDYCIVWSSFPWD